jgi:hypothetical protein
MNQMRPVPDMPGRASSHGAEERGRYSRHRYELPLLCVFLSLAAVELVTVHLLLALWSRTAAWLLTLLSLLAIAQIAWLIRGLVRNPHETDRQSFHIRHGAEGDIVVPLANIANAENVAFAPEQKGPDVFRASLIASPNVALHLAQPMMVRRRQISTITLRVDDPGALLLKLAARATAA